MAIVVHRGLAGRAKPLREYHGACAGSGRGGASRDLGADGGEGRAVEVADGGERAEEPDDAKIRPAIHGDGW
jgi:hypothetical protein